MFLLLYQYWKVPYVPLHSSDEKEEDRKEHFIGFKGVRMHAEFNLGQEDTRRISGGYPEDVRRIQL